MARRRSMSAQEVASMARRAVGEIASAGEGMEARAAQLLEQAGARALRQAIVEMSASAPDRVTGAVVSAALRAGDAELARTAAELLASMGGSPTALDVLRQGFEMQDPSVRARAVSALEGFANPEALAFLPRALNDETTAVRRAASGALNLLVASRYHPLTPPVIAELSDPASPLARAVLDNEDVDVRRQAAQALGFHRLDALLPCLDRLCEDEDEEVRQEAVLALAAIGTDSALQLMATRLGDPSYRVASSVLDMLAARVGAGSSQMLGYLRKAMGHPREETRRQAVLMLDRFAPSEIEDVLETATRDSDFEVARRAGEMLVKARGSAGIEWLSGEMDRYDGDERTLSLWEAGNVGLVAGSRAATLISDAATRAADVTPMLERALQQGTPSDKVHAVNELSMLLDMSDSPAMQAALNDPDSSVRSCAADTLSNTRDAGLLVRTLQSHPDATVRRRAVEALTRNPGGRKRQEGLGVVAEFSSARTVGMELLSAFVGALQDHDEGVRQVACAAIRDYGQDMGLVPVGTVTEVLERLADDQRISYLIQEDALQTAEAVRDPQILQFISQGTAAALSWYDQNVRSGSAGAQEPTAGPADLCAALECVGAAARAVRLIGPDAWIDQLGQWRDALRGGSPPSGATVTQAVTRARADALTEIVWAREALRGQPSTAELIPLTNDDDDWVKLTALRAVAALGTDDGGALDRVVELCAAHAEDRAYAEPLGRAADALLQAGRPDGAGFAAQAVAGADLDLRLTLTQKFLATAQGEEAARALMRHMQEDGAARGGLSAACLLLALRGAGHDVEGFGLPTGDGVEMGYARLALGAMGNDVAAADELESVLRTGEPDESYLAAGYLALARVRTAAPIFASVRDRDVPHLLRAFCAASSVRRGHTSVSWFGKVSGSVPGRLEADVVMHLCRAVEDTIPLMLRCADVNVGRFA